MLLNFEIGVAMLIVSIVISGIMTQIFNESFLSIYFLEVVPTIVLLFVIFLWLYSILGFGAWFKNRNKKGYKDALIMSISFLVLATFLTGGLSYLSYQGYIFQLTK